LVNNHCLLRGEEKGENSSGNPKDELENKIKWTYDPLLFIFGYHARKANVEFVAITTPPSTIQPLFNHDLSLKAARVANAVNLIRLCGVIAWLATQLEARDRMEFVPIERSGGKVLIHIGSSVVKKEFRFEGADAHVSHLVEIYELLKRKKVPNVDTLKNYSTDTESTYPHVYLSPVGFHTIPNSGVESFDAIVCVLAALEVMHSGPDPVYHRDIREPNIMKRYDGQGWFLIDWSDATTAPTRAATDLKASEHSPRVFQDGHGAEVDIWGVATYMEYLASRGTCRIAAPHAVEQMARRWIEDPSTSAVSALNEIKVSTYDLIIRVMY